ncbi:hypothetical protein ACLOJK_004282 [Asimina triloba]
MEGDAGRRHRDRWQQGQVDIDKLMDRADGFRRQPIIVVNGADGFRRQPIIAVNGADGFSEIRRLDGFEEKIARGRHNPATEETGSSWLAAVIDDWLRPHRISNEHDTLGMMDGADGPTEV